MLGGKPYNGRSMRAAHAMLNLANDHFDAVMNDLGTAMRELGVKEEYVTEVLVAAETTRNDVLGVSN